MRFIGRNRQEAPDEEPTPEEAVAVRPFSEVIASIEATAQEIRRTDVQHWKYRQILRDSSASSDLTDVAEGAEGAEDDANVAQFPGWAD
jgi:hypothetical protein